MKTINSIRSKPVEHATDQQLRQLTRPWAFAAPYKGIIQSGMPLLTSERVQLVNLLKSVNTFHFIQQ